MLLFVGLHIFSVGCQKQRHSIPISTASYLFPDLGPRFGCTEASSEFGSLHGCLYQGGPYVSSDQKTTIDLVGLYRGLILLPRYIGFIS